MGIAFPVVHVIKRLLFMLLDKAVEAIFARILHSSINLSGIIALQQLDTFNAALRVEDKIGLFSIKRDIAGLQPGLFQRLIHFRKLGQQLDEQRVMAAQFLMAL